MWIRFTVNYIWVTTHNVEKGDKHKIKHLGTPDINKVIGFKPFY